MKKVFLGIGSNIGDRAVFLQKSVDLAGKTLGTVMSVSPVYETDPWGFVSEDKVLNAVIEMETALNPSGLLGRILMIEAELGRLREGKGFASRTIDIDILFFGESVINEPALIVPHPKIAGRRFVLEPLNAIAPGLIHPVYKKSIHELLEQCPDTTSVRLSGIELSF